MREATVELIFIKMKFAAVNLLLQEVIGRYNWSTGKILQGRATKLGLEKADFKDAKTPQPRG